MGKPLDLTFYNPDQLEDEDFLAGFIARQDLANKILSRLRGIKPRGLAQHRLIVGQRGMGKTSLLRRIALGVRDQPDLAAVLLPLSFREEQYNVHNLHVFWCNCLDALGDWFEAMGRKNQAERLDRDVAALNTQDDDEEGSKALALFRDWMKKEQRRPLLLLDNLDIIFAGLKSKQWSLRRVLQEAGGIVVIGASAAALEAAADREGAFYDFFQVDVLAKLQHHEILLCLRHMAQQREEGGRKVLQILDRDPARIHVLYDLTGGNPRTLAMLYLVLETSGDDGVMRDLERLLDQATPLYKARVEELAPQMRVVFDALALAWDPATAAGLAAVTGLEVSIVSTQLDRLTREGIAEKVSLSTTSRAAFQVAERFFNIWYLMRHSSRRQRLRLRWLTEMLRRIYSPGELRERARDLLGRPAAGAISSPAYCLALSDALDDHELRTALVRSLRRSSLLMEGGSQSEEELSVPIAAHRPLPESKSAVETYRKAIERSPDDPGLWCGLGKLLMAIPESRVEAEAALRKAANLDSRNPLPWLNLGMLLTFAKGRLGEAEAAYQRAIELEPTSAESWTGIGLASLLGNSPDKAEEAFCKVLEVDPQKAYAWGNLGAIKTVLGHYDEAEAAYRKAIEISPQDALAWFSLGRLLAGLPERVNEAEGAYRKAIEISAQDALAWFSLGHLLAGLPERVSEAEGAYRKAIEINPQDAAAWNNLGALLAGLPERVSEAEGAYRKAIEINSQDAAVWNNLGSLLAGLPERVTEAEGAYHKAIEINPQDAAAWNNLGSLLAGLPERVTEAEAAYRKVIEINPQDAEAWDNLGFLLAGLPERVTEAEAAYRKAIELNPKDSEAWNSLGNLLADRLFRVEEAEKAYRKAMVLDSQSPLALANLVYLLLRRDGLSAEGEAFYQAALDALPSHGARLLRAFHALASDNFGTATEELRLVLEEGHVELFTVFRDDLLRILRFSAERGNGEKLLAWLKSADFGDRYWPLLVAFEAYLHGEDRLMDVNPEVRSGARRLLTEMTLKLRRPPQAEPMTTQRGKKPADGVGRSQARRRAMTKKAV